MYHPYYKILEFKYEFKLSKLFKGDIFQNAFFSHINVNIRWSNLKGEWGGEADEYLHKSSLNLLNRSTNNDEMVLKAKSGMNE